MEKMKSQIKALSKTTGSTWGLPMLQACQVYTAVIWPALTYGAMVWHHPQLTLTTKLSTARITGKLVKQQNKCIQMIASIYKITSLTTVETEVFISSLDLYLDSVISRVVRRIKKSRMICQIKIACTNIRRKLLCHYQNYYVSLIAVAHSKPLPVDWTRSWIAPPIAPANSPQNSIVAWEKREILCH
jgi:hypothetical protein